MLEAIVHLRGGGKLNVVIDGERTWSPNSLVDTTLQSFLNKGKTKKYLLQGSQILYIEVSL